MPRKLKQPKNLSLSEYLQEYSSDSVGGALREVQNSFAWGVLTAYLSNKQRMFEVAALDLIKHDGQIQASAHASGYAQALEDIVHKDIPEFLGRLSGQTGVVQDPRPEEVMS